jgi:hypothetical protein
MPSVSLKGVVYQAFPGSAALAHGTYYCHPGGPGIGDAPSFSGQAFIEAEHMWPEVPGIGTTRLSTFGTMAAQVDLAFVADSVNNAEGSFDGVEAGLAQLARYNVTLRGVSKDGWKLREAAKIGQMQMGGNVIVCYRFLFKRFGPTN